MEDIIADAAALGKKIAAHPRMQAFMKSAKAVNADKAAQEILKNYYDAVERVRQLEAGGKPIEVADKRTVAEAEAKLAGNDLLKEMMKTQADYMEMMHRINGAIDQAAGMAG